MYMYMHKLHKYILTYIHTYMHRYTTISTHTHTHTYILWQKTKQKSAVALIKWFHNTLRMYTETIFELYRAICSSLPEMTT